MTRPAVLLLAALLAAPAAAQPEAPLPPRETPPIEADAPPVERGVGLLLPDTELIDTPTAAVLDLGGFYSRTRFYSAGGLLQYLSFGVYPRVNIGASFNIDNLIGAGSPVRLRRPELQLKLRFFDGDQYLPALALGFDGQGYLYNRSDKVYNQRQRGLYVVGSQEVLFPGLHCHAGMSIADFDGNTLAGMLATSLNIRDRVKLMAEWDNIHNFVESRLNMGARVYVTPAFNFEFSVRSIGQGGQFPDGLRKGEERVVQLKYTGNF